MYTHEDPYYRHKEKINLNSNKNNTVFSEIVEINKTEKNINLIIFCILSKKGVGGCYLHQKKIKYYL